MPKNGHFQQFLTSGFVSLYFGYCRVWVSKFFRFGVFQVWVNLNHHYCSVNFVYYMCIHLCTPSIDIWAAHMQLKTQLVSIEIHPFRNSYLRFITNKRNSVLAQRKSFTVARRTQSHLLGVFTSNLNRRASEFEFVPNVCH